MNDKWYVVDDLDGFILSARRLVFNLFGKASSDTDFDKMINSVCSDEQAEFDDVISSQEAAAIVKNGLKKQTNSVTKEVRYLICDETFKEILETLNSRMISNILNNLVNKGYIESGFDSEANDFVFWIKETDDKTEKPETD